MAKLTSKQINILANNFLIIAQAIGEYRINNYDTLTKVQNKKLREFHRQILNYSDDLFTTSARFVMNDIQASLNQLEAITDKIKLTLKALDNIQHVINISARLVTLGASIFSLNVQAIGDSLSKLKATIDKINEE